MQSVVGHVARFASQEDQRTSRYSAIGWNCSKPRVPEQLFSARSERMESTATTRVNLQDENRDAIWPLSTKSDPARIITSSNRLPHGGRHCRGFGLGNATGVAYRGERQGGVGNPGARLAHDVPRFTSPRWRIATSC